MVKETEFFILYLFLNLYILSCYYFVLFNLPFGGKLWIILNHNIIAMTISF